MCGIAGSLTAESGRPVDFEELRRMIAVLGHRGPDGYGLYRDERIGLAHARLAIIGLENGAQPIPNEDRSVWVCCNGEVFNYKEMRRDLVARGHRFRTESDTEVIVHGYEEYGPDLWGRLNGQFAIALWDCRRYRLWLVRDRFGILPLHYARLGDRLLFASEAKALFAGGRLAPRFDALGLAQVFTRWSATPPATAFAGVESVRPGTALEIGTDLAAREVVYWRPRIVPDPDLARLSLDEAAEALGAKMTESVRLRLRADVPVGSYLSGGVDSGVVAALGCRARPGGLNSFSVRFADPAYDETAEQRLAAAALGTRHSEILCSAADIAGNLREVVWHCETPLTRTAGVPLFLLSRLVRDSGMKVVMTGEGADELLAGYGIFKEDRIRRFWARRPRSDMRPQLLARLYPYVGGAKAQGGAFWRDFFGQGLTALDDPFYSHRIRWRNTGWALRFLHPDIRAAAARAHFERDLEAAMPPGWPGWSPLARAQMIECDSFMSSYLLSCQGDRVAMAHGVEVRYPFLDPALVDFCFALPDRLKLRGLSEKVVLRRFADGLLPPGIARRPKRPYRAPTSSALFAGGGAAEIAQLLSEPRLRGLGLADPGPAGRLVAKALAKGGAMAGEREEMALTGLVTLQQLGGLFGSDFAGRTEDARRRLASVPCQVAVDGCRENGSMPLEGRLGR